MRNTLLTARTRAAKFLVLAVGVALAGCDLPTSSANNRYQLATVNQQALPAPYPDPLMPVGTFRVTAGRLRLHDDGTLSGSFSVECVPSNNTGNTCHVDDPEQEFEGAYSREEGWLELGERRYPADFSGGAVLVRIFIPSYMGYFPEYNVRFTR